MGVHVGGELVLGLGDAPPLHVDSHVLGDGDIERVGPVVGDDQVGEAAEAGGPHARVLVQEEADFFGVADELLQMDEMSIERVFRMDLGPFFGELLLVRRDVGGLDIQPRLGLQVGVLDLAFEAAGRPLGGLLDGGDLVVDRKPDAGVLAEGRGLEAVAQGPGLPLRRLGVDVRVEVQVHAEAVAGRVVGAGHGRESHVAAVGPLGPVGDEVLTVDAQPEPLDRGLRELGFAAGGEGEALGVDEVDLAVEGLGADLGDLADAADRNPIDQELEDQLVLVALALAVGGGLGGREGLAAGLALPAGRADRRGPEGRVMGLTGRDGDLAVLALLVRTAGAGLLFEVGPEPADLFVDAQVALDREMLAAAVAAEVRIVLAGGDDGVEIAFDAGGGAARRFLGGRNPEVLAARVLAEVDLDAADCGRDSRLLRLGRQTINEITERGLGSGSEVGFRVGKCSGRFLFHGVRQKNEAQSVVYALHLIFSTD